MTEGVMTDPSGVPDAPVLRISAERKREIGEQIESHIPALRRYLYILHRGNVADAEDSLQNGLLKAVERFDSFQGPDGFRSWLFSICRNTALDGFRSRTRRKESSGDVSEILDSMVSPHAGPAESAERSEVSRAVVDALLTLPERFRLPLGLKELEGFSVAEVARILGIPEGTVKSRLSVGRTRLARQFNRMYEGGSRGGRNE